MNHNLNIHVERNKYNYNHNYYFERNRMPIEKHIQLPLVEEKKNNLREDTLRDGRHFVVKKIRGSSCKNVLRKKKFKQLMQQTY